MSDERFKRPANGVDLVAYALAIDNAFKAAEQGRVQAELAREQAERLRQAKKATLEELIISLEALRTSPAIRGEQGPQGIPGPEGPTGPQGETGIQGPEGPAGATGATGQTGPQGETGAAGPKGDPGDQGIQGIQGIQGLKGDTGDTGAQGLPGNTGDTGATGPAGPQGPQGIQGETGLQGPQGTPGEQGPQGADGATGATGPEGPEGAQGPQGIQGATGAQGIQGIQGIQGLIGLTGEKGDTGDTGPQGIQGIQGIQGEPGTGFLDTATQTDLTGLLEGSGGTLATVAITDAGKALLDDADAAAQRATLGAMSAADVADGAFTPVLKISSSETGITYSTQDGYYSKSGKVVNLNINLILTSKGTNTGEITITGLPFAPKVTTSFIFAELRYVTPATGGAYLIGIIGAGSTYIVTRWVKWGASYLVTAGANLANNSVLRLTVGYTAE